MASAKVGDLAVVDWIDSRGVSASWSMLDDVRNDGVCAMQSVGWIGKINKEMLLICPHVGDDPKQVCGEMHIPMVAITKIRVVEPATEEEQ